MRPLRHFPTSFTWQTSFTSVMTYCGAARNIPAGISPCARQNGHVLLTRLQATFTVKPTGCCRNQRPQGDYKIQQTSVLDITLGCERRTSQELCCLTLGAPTSHEKAGSLTHADNHFCWPIKDTGEPRWRRQITISAGPFKVQGTAVTQTDSHFWLPTSDTGSRGDADREPFLAHIRNKETAVTQWLAGLSVHELRSSRRRRLFLFISLYLTCSDISVYTKFAIAENHTSRKLLMMKNYIIPTHPGLILQFDLLY